MLNNRRRFLTESCLGIGGLALADLLSAATEPLAARPQHMPRKAKSCIFLFMEGGVSQMDLFEHKPMLSKYAGRQMPAATNTVGEIATFSAAPNRVIPPVAPFKQYGQSGIPVSEIFPHVATCVDDLAIVRSMVSDHSEHTAANYFMHSGSGFQLSSDVTPRRASARMQYS